MSILGSLSVNLVANTARFQQQMTKARGTVQKFSAAAEKYGLMVGAATLTAGVAFTRNALETIDALGKQSRQLGITTEALGAYQHAANLSGIETNSLHNALMRMNDTIGAAMMGEKGAIRALEQMGLTAEDLRNAKDPLVAIQSGLAGIADQAQRVALVRDIFGRSGGEMLNLFENDLARVRKEYEKMGASISGEDAAKIEKLNDSMYRLAEMLKGKGNRIVIEAAPGLQETVEMLQGIHDFYFGSDKGTAGGFFGDQLKQQIFRNPISRLAQPLVDSGIADAVIGTYADWNTPPELKIKNQTSYMGTP